MEWKKIFSLCILAALMQLPVNGQGRQLPALRVSANGHYLLTGDGQPFFWLGDTGWLLFVKLNREEAGKYLEDRRQKGFNVIQAMVLHTLTAVNVYGDTALKGRNVATPNTTPGNAFGDAAQYDFWDHVDYIVDLAAQKGIYMALVPVWGANVKSGGVKEGDAARYAQWLAARYRNRSNIIWMNGGDIKGSDSMNVWKAIGQNIHQHDPAHLVTFHPFGRTSSSEWFHNEAWLQFNMFQSGHRSYDLDTSAEEHKFGPDNYKFVEIDYKKQPVKPTLDGEPSYEEIPYGLHDTTKPRWKDYDVRRYGYWEVFAGGAGYTYGHNSVMQMHKPTDKGSSYGALSYWYDAINYPGAGQMVYLKKLLLSRSYFDRVPDQSLVAGEPGGKYKYIAATRGGTYAYLYDYTGRPFSVNMGKISGSTVQASWYNPRNGKTTRIGQFNNKGVQAFTPPGKEQEGNDWVLILESTK
ncbi:MAG: glycoside hydrolase family 140 protein [Williamsia sp.]|nr:glycoside hydrolase family 140 protein [Williamsia sp.]